MYVKEGMEDVRSADPSSGTWTFTATVPAVADEMVQQSWVAVLVASVVSHGASPSWMVGLTPSAYASSLVPLMQISKPPCVEPCE